MNSFTKFAENSYENFRAEKSILEGGNKYVDTYINTLYPPKVESPLNAPNVEGGLRVLDGIPPTLEVESKDLSLENLTNLVTGNWSTDYYQQGVYFFTRYFMGLSVFLIFYWLLAPGQLLQLWNSRSYCNTKTFGKGTLGLNFNSSVESTYVGCESILSAGLPSTNETDISNYRRCENLINCSKRAKWGTYYSSLPSILIHGLLLGVILSLTTSLGQFIPGLNMYSSMFNAYLAYAVEWFLYILSYPFRAMLYGSEQTAKALPDLSTYENIGVRY